MPDKRDNGAGGTRNRPRDEIGVKRGYWRSVVGTLAYNHTSSFTPETSTATVVLTVN